MRGNENVVTDHLSRLEHEEEDTDKNIKKIFPNEYLLRMEVKLSWFANLVNFLACKVLPPDLTLIKKDIFASS